MTNDFFSTVTRYKSQRDVNFIHEIVIRKKRDLIKYFFKIKKIIQHDYCYFFLDRMG